VNKDETKPPPKLNEDVLKPSSRINIEYDGIKSEDEDYEYLILKPDHFKIGTFSKGKDILQNEDPNFNLISIILIGH